MYNHKNILAITVFILILLTYIVLNIGRPVFSETIVPVITDKNNYIFQIKRPYSLLILSVSFPKNEIPTECSSKIIIKEIETQNVMLKQTFKYSEIYKTYNSQIRGEEVIKYYNLTNIQLIGIQPKVYYSISVEEQNSCKSKSGKFVIEGLFY